MEAIRFIIYVVTPPALISQLLQCSRCCDANVFKRPVSLWHMHQDYLSIDNLKKRSQKILKKVCMRCPYGPANGHCYTQVSKIPKVPDVGCHLLWQYAKVEVGCGLTSRASYYSERHDSGQNCYFFGSSDLGQVQTINVPRLFIDSGCDSHETVPN